MFKFRFRFRFRLRLPHPHLPPSNLLLRPGEWGAIFLSLHLPSPILVPRVSISCLEPKTQYICPNTRNMPEAPEPIKDTRVVTLTSKDGVPIELPASAAARSMFIKEALLEGHEDDDDDEDEDLKELVMEIPRVRSEALGHIVEFLKHYDEEPMREISVPLEGNTFEEVRP